MNLTTEQLWQRFQRYYRQYPKLGLALDISRVNFPESFFETMSAPIEKAFNAMAELEKGAIANPDEGRRVGHYWLRNPGLAPEPGMRRQIEQTVTDVKAFAAKVHQGQIAGARGLFKNLLVIGIGGSALGPQFVANALSQPATDKLDPYFFDNTDPDGMDKVMSRILTELGQTLCIVISKSGETKETRNGMIEAQAAYEKAGLKFADHAVAVTGAASKLDKQAASERWLARFPMWDWVGGRTSELSAVGLLPAALQGFDIDSMLAGARLCDEQTRIYSVTENPAALLSLMWFHTGNGKGSKDMVIIPYKDRLELLSRYLQQLVMESLGKELDLQKRVVNQGIAVYGNKGSTDQHAYIQQLREGVPNFFATLIEVLKDREGESLSVEDGVTSGDYLSGFLLGTRLALFENGRESITITVNKVSPFSIGVLIALFERAVGFYATLVNINAYHQPGVQAGKKAADKVIELQLGLTRHLEANRGTGFRVAQLAKAVGAEAQVETAYKILEHLAANPSRGVVKKSGTTPFDATYEMV